MKILITGVAGTVGIHLCKALLEAGEQVVGLDNFVTGSAVNIKAVENHPQFSRIDCSIDDPELLNRLKSETFDEIYHLACPTGVPNLKLLQEEMISAFSIGTWNILKLAAEKKAKLLYMSSLEVYRNALVSPQTEDYTGNVDPVGPRSPYEEGKRFSEALVRMYIQKYQLDAKIVRLFNTYGPVWSEKDQRVIPTFIKHALKNEDLPVHGSGKQKRTFLFIDDLIQGLVKLMRTKTEDFVFNMGSDKDFTILELAELIIEVTQSESKCQFVDAVPFDHQARMPCLKRIKDQIGWQPSTPLRDGISRILERPE